MTNKEAIDILVEFNSPRSNGTRHRKTVPQFIDDFEASFSGDF